MNLRKSFSKTLAGLLVTGTALSISGNAKAYEWITNPDNGHQYSLTNSSGTWQEMQEEAESQDGYLACIKDENENKFLVDNFANINTGTTDLFIGLTDKDQEGSFKWADNSNLEFTKWASGEPNNLREEDFVAFYNEENSNPAGLWNDRNKEHNTYGIIERPGNIIPPSDIYLTPENSINEALESITGSRNHPVRVHLAPGIYNENVSMNEWENIIGEGDSSIIKGSVITANNSYLLDLSVESPKLHGEHVCIDATDKRSGIYNVHVNGKGNKLGVGILLSNENTSNRSALFNSTITGNGIGISYNNSDSVIYGNTIRNNEYGLWFFDSEESGENKVDSILKTNIFQYNISNTSNLSPSSRN